MLSAGVANDKGDFSPDFDHMTLIVDVKKRLWLADVGFGDSFIEPLSLDDSESPQRECRYQIVKANRERFVMERALKDGDWKPQYRFSLRPHQYSDYAEMCRYHQTSPESHFTRQRICSRLTPHGRISLSDMRLIVIENRVRSERQITSQKEYSEVLREQFGIVM